MATAINIEDLKILRSQLGTGVADTKAALLEADGDLERATEILRLKGAKANAKKADRPIEEGLVASASVPGGAALITLACETDFVAKNERFTALADRVVEAVAGAGSAQSVEQAKLALTADGSTVGELIDAEAAVLGERIELVRVSFIQGEPIEVYLHRSSKDLPPQFGVLVSYAGGDSDSARAVAQHIAAYSPSVVSREDVPQEELDREIEILTAIAKQEGKPEAIIEKIIAGKLDSYLKARALLEQPFARDASITVGKFLQDAGMEVLDFARMAVRD